MFASKQIPEPDNILICESKFFCSNCQPRVFVVPILLNLVSTASEPLFVATSGSASVKRFCQGNYFLTE